jgi:hypothetical protein
MLTEFQWGKTEAKRQFGDRGRRVKGKGIPVTGHGGPQGCETLRVLHYLDNQLTDASKVVSLTRRPPFTPQGYLVLISVRG